MKKIQSVIFRVVLILLAIGIIRNYPTQIPEFLYFIFLIAYFGVYLVLRIRDLALYRLIWDFLFINIIVLYRDSSVPLLFFFIITPLINAINYTGKKSHYFFLLLLTIGSLAFHIGKLDILFLLPVIGLGIMYFFSNMKYSQWNIEREITNQVDEYFRSPVKLKSHQIYIGIISKLNQYFHYNRPHGIKRILAYTLKGEALWLVNASSFIWERNTSLDSVVLDKLKKKGSLYARNNNEVIYYYYINKYDLEYVFVCEVTDYPNRKLFFELRIGSILNMAFDKLSMLLNTEYRMQQRREEKFNEIKDSVQYVNHAVRVMHFIRNKMTPLSNLVAYHKAEDIMDADVKRKLKKRFSKEVDQADTDLKDILKYANYLLDKSNNPFAENEISEIPIHRIFVVLSELTQSHFGNVVNTDVNLQSEELKSRVIHSNLIQCKILMTDWIENMRKNSGNYNAISMRYEDQALIIRFENTYVTSEDEIMRFVRDMNSMSKDAVLEGKNYGHGIYIIKSVAREFGIDIKTERSYDQEHGYLLCLNLKFPTYERKENTDI